MDYNDFVTNYICLYTDVYPQHCISLRSLAARSKSWLINLIMGCFGMSRRKNKPNKYATMTADHKDGSSKKKSCFVECLLS